MIEINLLPDDLRKTEGLPVRRIGALAGGAVLVSAALMLVLSIHFGMLQTAQAELTSAENRLAALSPDVRYADALKREKAEYTRRSETIQQISDSRVLWTKKVDQLFDVVDYGEKADRHFVWLTELKVSAPRANVKGQTADGGELDIRGYSATEVLQKYSDFHEDLKQSEFFSDFNYIDDPAGKVVDFPEDVRPQKAWDFQLKMKLDPPGQAKPGSKAPAKPAPKAAGNGTGTNPN